MFVWTNQIIVFTIVQKKLNLQQKLELGVVWNRTDIVTEILDTGTKGSLEDNLDLITNRKRSP